MPWVEKLLMILGKIWTQFLLKENYGCAREQIYLWCQKKFVIVCIIYVLIVQMGTQTRGTGRNEFRVDNKKLTF